MRFNYNLSVLVPGIRNELWPIINEHMSFACKRFSWEIIFCGPRPLPATIQDKINIKYIKDYGTPTRALQLASMFAEGRFLTWIPDDSHLYPDSIDKAIDLLLAHDPGKDVIGLRYCEGENHSGNEHTHPIHYSNVSTHPDLQAPAVNRNWIAPGIQLWPTSYYKALGGLDCRFEHTNMNLFDLAYRAQMNESRVIMTPWLVINADWSSTRNAQNSEVIAAFSDNDRPLYWKIWGEGGRPVAIDPDGEMGWRGCDVVWKRKKNEYSR